MDPVIFGGGMFTTLLAVKEVRKTIGRLISGLGDIPQAYLEGLSERIRSDNTAKKTITSAIVTAARDKISDDTALVDRGLERWTKQLAAKQSTRESIALQTLGVLIEGGLPDRATAPSEEFMRTFEDIAEKVSSEEMIDLMGRILAGEIRKPSSVSRRTLATLPVLDKEVIDALVEVRRHLLDNSWVHVSPGTHAEWAQRFALLASISLSSEVSARMLPSQEGVSMARISNKAVLMAVKPSFGAWFVDGAHLTPTGRELSLLLPRSAESPIKEIALGFKEHDFVERVTFGSIREESQIIRIIDITEV